MSDLLLISGFLGAGKTTLIRKLLTDGLEHQRVALVENEFGEIGIDGALLRPYGLPVREISSGCICCTLAGALDEAIQSLLEDYRPDLILIEPSGVAGLSTLLEACRGIPSIGRMTAITVVDTLCHAEYADSFGDFYTDQIIHAHALVCSKTEACTPEAVNALCQELSALNPAAALFAAAWDSLPGDFLLRETRRRFALPAAAPDPACAPTARIFTSVTLHPSGIYTPAMLRLLLRRFSDPALGHTLRVKGFLHTTVGWVQVDYTRGHTAAIPCPPPDTPSIVFIGCQLHRDRLEALFGKAVSLPRGQTLTIIPADTL